MSAPMHPFIYLFIYLITYHSAESRRLSKLSSVTSAIASLRAAYKRHKRESQFYHYETRQVALGPAFGFQQLLCNGAIIHSWGHYETRGFNPVSTV